MIKKSYSFMIITFLVMCFISINNVKAFTFDVNVKKNRDVVFGAMKKSVYPFGNQTGNVGVGYENLNHNITCNTNKCGVEYYYTATYSTNVASTSTIDVYAISAQLNTNDYPVCSVSGGVVSCIVNNNRTINGVFLYFAYSSESLNWSIDTNLMGVYTIFDIPDSTSSAITDAINNQTQQQHQDSQAINNSINNDNVDSASSSADSWNSKNASNGVITQLLTLPITLLNSIVSGIQTSCASFNLGNLFGTDIILPCISLSNLIGSTLFTTIDLLISGFMIYNISKKLIKIFNDFTNLKSNQIDEIYGGGSN